MLILALKRFLNIRKLLLYIRHRHVEIQSSLKISMGFSLLNRNDLYLWLVAGLPKSSPGFIDVDRKSSTILGCWKEAISHYEHFTAGVHCRGC